MPPLDQPGTGGSGSTTPTTPSDLTFIAEGATIRAAAPFTAPQVIVNGTDTVITTNVDLSEVDFLEIDYARTDSGTAQLGQTRKISLKNFTYDDDDGYRITITNTDQFRVRIDTADIPTGVIRINGVNIGTEEYTISEIRFKKLADVTEGRFLLFDGPINTNTTANLDNGLTWQEVADTYEKLEFSMLLPANNQIVSGEVDLSNFVDDSIISVGLHSGLHFNLGSTLDKLQFDESEFRFVTTNNSTNAANLKIYGVLPHGRVSALPPSVLTGVLSTAQTPNLNNIVVGQAVTLSDFQHSGEQGAVQFNTNGDIVLAQRQNHYVLKWYGGFDFDGDIDQEGRLEFAGPNRIQSLDATADVFDTTADNVTFSKYSWMRPVAYAVFDASTGPITVRLQGLDASTGLGPTGGVVEVTSQPVLPLVLEAGQAIITNPLSPGVLTSNRDGSFTNQTGIFQIVPSDLDVPDDNFISSGLLFNVQAGKRYKFKFHAVCVVHATPDIKFRLDAPEGAATNGIIAITHAENAIGKKTPFGTTTGRIACATSANAANADPFVFEGWLDAAVDGTVELFLGRQDVGTAATVTTLLQNSWLESKEVPS